MLYATVDEKEAALTGSTQWNAFTHRSLFGSLDGLRGLSILVVVWHHAARSQFESHSLLSQGALGVELFFAISGFLITTLLLREKKKIGTISLKHFYIRRTLRIVPLYFTVLAIYVVLVAILEQHSIAGRQFWSNLGYYLTYTCNWFVRLGDERVIFYFAWSLATEEQFYLLWPFMERQLRGYRPVLLMAVVVLIVEIARSGGLSWILSPDSLGLTIVKSIAPPICLGVLLAHLLHWEPGFEIFYRIAGHRWSSPVVVVAITICLLWGIDRPWQMFILHSLLVLLVGACVVREDHVLAPLLTNKMLRSIGVVSYGMYLYHMLAINAVRMCLYRVGIHAVYVDFVASASMAFAIAWISYNYYESVFLRMKERYGGAGPKTLVGQRLPMPGGLLVPPLPTADMHRHLQFPRGYCPGSHVAPAKESRQYRSQDS